MTISKAMIANLIQYRLKNPDAGAKHSVFKHHVDCLDYLCLLRTPELTIKLYLMEQPVNGPLGYLVAPHTHRYAFDTLVLHGRLEHVRFTARPGFGWREGVYEPDTKAWRPITECTLDREVVTVQRGQSYYMHHDQIHSLKVRENDGPVLLALAQYHDVQNSSRMFIPDHYNIEFPKSRTPLLGEYVAKLHTARELMTEK